MTNKSEQADTRTRLLRAALETFSERGYDGTTTREVANRAGVTEVTLFRHFGNKVNLLRCALEPGTPLPRTNQLAVGMVRPDPEEFFPVLAERIWQGMMGERRRLLQVLVGELPRRPELGPAAGQMPVEFVASIGDYLTAMQKEGKVREGNPRLMALAFLGMFFSAAVGGDFLAKEGEAFTPEETIREYVAVFLDGVRKGSIR